jgi:hypothetical protein
MPPWSLYGLRQHATSSRDGDGVSRVLDCVGALRVAGGVGAVLNRSYARCAGIVDTRRDLGEGETNFLSAPPDQPFFGFTAGSSRGSVWWDKEHAGWSLNHGRSTLEAPSSPNHKAIYEGRSALRLHVLYLGHPYPARLSIRCEIAYLQ